MPRTEHQLKIKGVVDRGLLLSLEAEPLGQVSQKDIYLAGPETRRIRIEGDQYLYAEKEQDTGERVRTKHVTERLITKQDVKQLIRQDGVRVTTCKSRAYYRLGNTLIAQDAVEQLGDFIEFHSDSEGELLQILSRLGLEEIPVKASYLDLMVAENIPGWKRKVLGLHDRVGEAAFGITSGILTTVGVLIGVNSASGSKLPVIAAICAIGVADSCSDAFGMYNAKISERGTTASAAARYAFGTLAGKVIMPITFLIPIFLLSLPTAVRADLAWATLALGLLSAEQAIAGEKSLARSIGKNIGMALLIVLLSYMTGLVVKHFAAGAPGSTPI